MTFQSLYDILGVASTATPDEIKDAYRRQAMKWHPDRNIHNRSEAEDRFKEIGYAYKVLSDPQQRAEYDVYVSSQKNSTDQQHQKEPSFGAGMSDDDAEKMFFEQMLDLALELARRGYDAVTIAKTLVALDCPESIAKSVAETVIRAANQNGDARKFSKSYQSHTDPKADSLETASWASVEPYYAAVIGGIHADDRISDDEYHESLEASKKGISGYVVSFVAIILGTILGAKNSIGLWIAGAGAALLVATIIWRIINGGTAAFRREKNMRYYLAAFESYHNARPLPFRFKTLNIGGCLSSVFWIAYRRMPIYALIGVVVVAVISSIFVIIETNAPELEKTFNLSGLVISAIVGLMANRIYFSSARRRINKVLALPRRPPRFE